MSVRKIVKRSFVAPLARQLYFRFANRKFRGSTDYWQKRYNKGGSSGAGSVGRLARFKADILNRFVRDNAVSSIVEFGCGDGSQLALSEYPRYLGLDVSPAAVERCRRHFSADQTKSFAIFDAADYGKHDAALSLDVIYHLIEDDIFESYMSALFRSARRFVIIYSSNGDNRQSAPHVRHRKFTEWVEQNRPDWMLVDVTTNKYPYDPYNEDETSFADFYFFKAVAVR